MVPVVEVEVPPSSRMIRQGHVPRAVRTKQSFNRPIAAQPKTRLETATRLGPVTPELDPTLLEPAAAPDCAFRGTMSSPPTVEETRMKLDYEAQCYRQSEEIVRTRLHRLQDAVEKMIRPARQSSR